MTVKNLLQFMHQAERLKSVTRHCFTKDGVPETVAAHSWRLSLFALLLEEEMQDVDMNRILRMCVIHDLGEAVTGDIPSFLKTEEQGREEQAAIVRLLASLPDGPRLEIGALFSEIERNKSKEARLFHALDKLEAVIQHNESHIDTWLPLEYTLNQTYGEEEAKGFPFLESLRRQLKIDTLEKIAGANDQ